MTRTVRVNAFVRILGAVAGALALSILVGTTGAEAQRHPTHSDGFASVTERSVAEYGGLRYVCSPSGFGHTSTCKLRASSFIGG